MLAKIKYFFKAYIVPNRLFLIRKPAPDKPLYITFDDGPVKGIIEPLLNLLAKYQVKATFFIIGSRGEKQPQLLQKIHNAQHTLANHSYSHPDFHQISHQAKLDEIVRTNQLIETITLQSCRFFRAPQGRWDFKILWYLFKKNIIAAHWSRDSMDFKKDPVEVIIERFKRDPVKAGDIILFHDDAKLCIEALSVLIPLWQSQGFTLKALKETK